MKKTKRVLGILLSFALVIGIMPGMSMIQTAYADVTTFNPASNYTKFASLVNKTKTVKIDGVKKDGELVEWYVIGYQPAGGSDTGVATAAGAVTLLAKESLTDNVPFREEGYNAYAYSDLHGILNGLMISMFSDVSDAMMERILSATSSLPRVYDYQNYDYIFDFKGTSISAQLWPLSAAEASGVNYYILSGDSWWLRSPGTRINIVAIVKDGDVAPGDIIIHEAVDIEYPAEHGVRPALQLDLSKVMFNETNKTFYDIAAINNKGTSYFVNGTMAKSGGTTYKVKSASAKTVYVEKGANKTKVTIPATVTVKGNKCKVTGISAGAFAKTKTKSLVIKTKKLTKKSVKGSLKGSKVKQIKVKVGGKKANKKYKKKYKKIFKKKNSGRKVKVK